jgi:hypothetical protein
MPRIELHRSSDVILNGGEADVRDLTSAECSDAVDGTENSSTTEATEDHGGSRRSIPLCSLW